MENANKKNIEIEDIKNRLEDFFMDAFEKLLAAGLSSENAVKIIKGIADYCCDKVNGRLQEFVI